MLPISRISRGGERCSPDYKYGFTESGCECCSEGDICTTRCYRIVHLKKGTCGSLSSKTDYKLTSKCGRESQINNGDYGGDF